MPEQHYAEQLQLRQDKLRRQRETASNTTNTTHIENITSNDSDTVGNQINRGRKDAASGEESDSGVGGQPGEQGNQQPNQQEQKYAAQLAADRNTQQQDAIKTAAPAADKKKQENNVAGPMLKVGIAFCMIRDFGWVLAMLLLIVPLGFTQMASMTLLISLAVLTVVPFLTDKKFVIFMTKKAIKEAVDISKSKGGGASGSATNAGKKAVKSAVKDFVIANAEFVIPILIVIPGYTFIFGYLIKQFEKSPKSSSSLSSSSIKNDILDTQKKGKLKNRSRANLGAAAGAEAKAA